MSSSSAAPARTSRGRGPRRVVARRRRPAERPSTPPRRSTPSTRCSSCTPRGTTGKPEGHPAHHRRLPDPDGLAPTTRSSTSSRRPTSTGAPPTSAGSPGTPTSCTARWPTARRRSCTRARPDTPHQGRFWEIVQKYGVTILYTAPTAIRTFMKWGDDIPAKFDLSQPAASSGPSASRSTPRRGSGTASTSAATDARSSTPGGRPRPAP